ncbi:hypothetical protein PIB30_037824 [Stylosanthes scabra]|uniref:Uncharacterized protein n=1 Tax=Stylosanthes scabra TaxID=79078 RepID=A0ABU6RDY5_9FABA|nr:hypothetical protein [Stylosanthes scabra]
MALTTGSTQDQDHICIDLVRIYPLNNRKHHGYIKRRSTLLQVRLLNPTQLLYIRRLPNPYLATLPLHAITHSHQLPAFFLGPSGYSGNPKPLEDEEGVPYNDHSGDEQRQNSQPNPQQADLDLNATANGSQESAGRNAETDGAQNGQLNSGGDRSGGRQSTSAFDRLGPGNPEPRTFGGIGSDNNQIMQDLRHRSHL